MKHLLALAAVIGITLPLTLSAQTNTNAYTREWLTANEKTRIRIYFNEDTDAYHGLVTWADVSIPQEAIGEDVITGLQLHAKKNKLTGGTIRMEGDNRSAKIELAATETNTLAATISMGLIRRTVVWTEVLPVEE